MGVINDLTTGIETRVASVLSPSFTKLGFSYTVERNAFKGATERYGVIPGDILEVDFGSGVSGSFTVSQNYTIKLTNRYSSSQVSDLSQKTTVVELLEKCLEIYKDLVITKAGSPSIVLNVLDGMSTETTFYEEDYVAEATMDFQVLYRKLL